jgi:hypothetical protein
MKYDSLTSSSLACFLLFKYCLFNFDVFFVKCDHKFLSKSRTLFKLEIFHSLFAEGGWHKLAARLLSIQKACLFEGFRYQLGAEELSVFYALPVLGY